MTPKEDKRIEALEVSCNALSVEVKETRKLAKQNQTEMKILYTSVKTLNENTQELVNVFNSAKGFLVVTKWFAIIATAAGGLWLTFTKIIKGV